MSSDPHRSHDRPDSHGRGNSAGRAGPPGRRGADGAEGRFGGQNNPRHFRRAESHDESHAQSAAAQPGPVAAHPLASSAPPALVLTQADLADMLAHARAAGAFAFDSEFIGEMSYVPRLCLVQTATAERVFLADPLAKLDLAGVWELVTDPAAEKIVQPLASKCLAPSSCDSSSTAMRRSGQPSSASAIPPRHYPKCRAAW